MSRLAASLLALLALPALAEKQVEANGYAASRSSYSRSRTWGLLPTDDLPQLQETLELNAQLKVSVRPRSYAALDVSLLGVWAGNFRGRDAQGHEVVLADRSSPYAQPAVSINELYLTHEFLPALTVLLGKKRVVWGSGVAFNPTDFFNPRRDPTDPTFQRAGAWLAEVEVPLEVLTFSAVFVPEVTEQVAGIPTHLVTFPDWDAQDAQAHWEAALRAYALVGDADVNVMLFYGNRFHDDFVNKLRVGASFSRYFFTDYELHFEALIQSGSARSYLEPACVASTLDALRCVQDHRAVLVQPRLDDPMLLPQVLVGTRRQFSDDSMVSLEYLWQADGWTRADFQSYANGLDLLEQGRAAGLPVNRIPGASALLGGSSGDGVPGRFSFEPRAQHYLFASYQKPRIADDFTAQLVVIANLQDLSTLWAPSLSWSATEWLTLTAYGFVPAPGPDALAVRTPAGTAVSEYGSLPFAWRALFEARVFY